MIAETHGKISSTGSNLTDRMEDKLTGDFFGHLRYLPFHMGLKKVLFNAKTLNEDDSKRLVQKLMGIKDNGFIGDKIKFWLHHEIAELDLQIELDNLFIGVEVKYNSGLSSEDQLERELEVINSLGNSAKQKVLLFISRGSGLLEAIESVKKLKMDREKLLDGIIFAYISWEDIHEIFDTLDLKEYTEYEKLIANDIRKLLTYKGFDKFKDFYSIKDIEVGKDFFEFKDVREVVLSFDYGLNVNGDGYYGFG